MASSSDPSHYINPIREWRYSAAPPKVFRVCREPHADLSGVGAERASGRWHTRRPGMRALYAAADPSTALLEVVIKHLGDIRFVPPDLVLVHIELMLDIQQLKLSREVRSLDEDWMEHVERTRAIGDHWLSQDTGLVLFLPSALSPLPAVNVLINAKHPTAGRVLRVGKVEPIAPKIARALAGLQGLLH
jgi:RES domain-containing protein